MKLGYGLLTCQRYPGDPRTAEELYREAIELAVEAESLGFDSIWLSEHHFVDDGYMPSLLPVAAAIAARTERIEIGTGLLLAPFHDPLRLAEDAATVDLISGGRLLLGLGLGWRAEELEAFGVPSRERVRRLVETIAVLRQAWSDGLVTGTPSRPYPSLSVTPKPPRAGGPPIWIGAFAEAAIRRAGQLADGFMGAELTPGILAEQVGWIREELARAGRSDAPFEQSIFVPTFAWTGDDPWQVVREHHWYVTWKYEDMDGARSRASGPAPFPTLPPEREEELRASILVGSPAEVAERIAAYDAAIGGGLHFIARLHWPGLDPVRQREAMRVFAEEVAPLLRGR